MTEPSYPTPTPSARAKGWRTPIVLMLAGATGVGGLCLGGAIGSAIGGGKADPAATVYVTATTRPGGTAGTGAAAQPTKPAAAGITDEGVLLVPSEVRPGTYRATVPADSIGCYWARLKAPQDDFDSIIANGNGDAGAKMTVTIRSTDKAFKTEGCGDWTRIG